MAALKTWVGRAALVVLVGCLSLLILLVGYVMVMFDRDCLADMEKAPSGSYEYFETLFPPTTHCDFQFADGTEVHTERPLTKAEWASIRRAFLYAGIPPLGLACFVGIRAFRRAAVKE